MSAVEPSISWMFKSAPSFSKRFVVSTLPWLTDNIKAITDIHVCLSLAGWVPV